LIVGWTLHISADAYTVTGKVPAPPLTEGAVITSPADGTTTASNTLLVEGTCPDASYVTLTRNNAFSGVSVCAADHTFHINTALSPGTNQLIAQDFNITDDAGPTTPAVSVTYNPPDSGGGSSSGSNDGGSPASGSTGSQPLAPVEILSSYHFQAIPSTQTFTYQVTLRGGQAPYTLTIDWGDDTQDINTYVRAGTVTISHNYTSPGYYTIIVSISDSHGSTSTLQLITFIKVPGSSGVVFSVGNTTAGPPENPLLSALTASKWLLVAWPAYTVVMLMVASFWLGERQELRLLKLQPIRVRSGTSRRRTSH